MTYDIEINLFLIYSHLASRIQKRSRNFDFLKKITLDLNNVGKKIGNKIRKYKFKKFVEKKISKKCLENLRKIIFENFFEKVLPQNSRKKTIFGKNFKET